MKSETYSVNLPSEMSDGYHIYPDNSTRGTQGPVQVAYPNYIYDQSNNFLQGMAELGVPIIDDPNRGIGYGAAFAPSSMDPKTQTRSDARTAYVDSVIDRSNLHIATQQTVTRILLEKRNATTPVAPYGILRHAVGVEAAGPNGTRWDVTCSKEVILAAGALISPVLLQVSGIGPASLLASINATVQVDLPGVGQNLQDHGMVAASYECTYNKPSPACIR